jgi:hypothetical protein
VAAREIQIISTSTGAHYLLFGLDSGALSSFSIQMWITKYGKRAVDWVQGLSLGFISFMGGDVYVHNATDVPRANLFGEQKEVKVGVIANQDSNIIKILDSIGIHSDKEWYVDSVTIPQTLNYPNGQYSKIPLQRFKRREGVLRAAFLRNMKTSSGTISAIEAIKGEPLRGYSAYIVLKNTDTTEVRLFKIDINMSKSR